MFTIIHLLKDDGDHELIYEDEMLFIPPVGSSLDIENWENDTSDSYIVHRLDYKIIVKPDAPTENYISIYVVPWSRDEEMSSNYVKNIIESAGYKDREAAFFKFAANQQEDEDGDKE
jgi:hypothetical protein